ncbi:hypothetical protein [Gluconobacter albidus]|uniref:hypothetical protein n=1 Tax=Gluconobacter albidus TaxID=318683 RepID=UPI000A78A2F8|nr:hypothetical protein [Gluconobacter albidus]
MTDFPVLPPNSRHSAHPPELPVRSTNGSGQAVVALKSDIEVVMVVARKPTLSA